MALYNFMLAFTICGIVIIIGEVVSTLTKAWIPSVFVSACLFLVGYWTVLPKNLVPDSYLIPFGATTGIFLLVTHLGTIISLRQLIDSWKTVVICLTGLLGMCLSSYFIAPFFMERALVISGLPPLTGGIVAATMMQAAATKAGLATAAVFAITMYCVQGFAGYPLTAICLIKEGRRILEDYRAGRIELTAADRDAISSVMNTAAEEGNVLEKKKRKFLQVPDRFNSSIVILTKLGFVAWLAMLLGPITHISAAIWALVLGVVFCTLGFLDRNSLHKANSFNIIMFALMMYIFSGLSDCTPEMLSGIIVPMIVLIVVGVTGMFIFAFVIAKILRVSIYLAFANCMTALYGFPFDQIITIATCDSLAKNKEEHAVLMGKMFPSMIIGGFVTVTITSVFIAGIFAEML